MDYFRELEKVESLVDTFQDFVERLYSLKDDMEDAAKELDDAVRMAMEADADSLGDDGSGGGYVDNLDRVDAFMDTLRNRGKLSKSLDALANATDEIDLDLS